MKDQGRSITRRDFLRGSAGIAVAATAGLPRLVAAAEEAEAAEKVRVVLVRDKEV
ncbi:MAG: twin-arginine translocation signal domain-containing protein, partial [Planctomycetota bacterium]